MFLFSVLSINHRVCFSFEYFIQFAFPIVFAFCVFSTHIFVSLALSSSYSLSFSVLRSSHSLSFFSFEYSLPFLHFWTWTGAANPCYAQTKILTELPAIWLNSSLFRKCFYFQFWVATTGFALVLSILYSLLFQQFLLFTFLVPTVFVFSFK